MQILNGNPLDLSGNNGEAISVAITASGTVAAASLSLNGAPFSGGSFTLNSSFATTFILVVFVIFSGTSGGEYTITLTGSNGGTASHVIKQLPNQASNSVAFTIDVA